MNNTSQYAIAVCYLQLMADLEDSGWSVSYTTLGIGSLDHFNLKAITTLFDVLPLSS